MHEDQTPSRRRGSVPLDSWDGVTTETGSGSVHVSVSYISKVNAVIIRKMGEADIYYGFILPLTVRSEYVTGAFRGFLSIARNIPIRGACYIPKASLHFRNYHGFWLAT